MTRTIPVNWESDTHCVSSTHAVELWKFQPIDQKLKMKMLYPTPCLKCLDINVRTLAHCFVSEKGFSVTGWVTAPRGVMVSASLKLGS